MPRRALLVLLFGLASLSAGVGADRSALASEPPQGDAPPATVNPFLPEDRSIGECISAVPKPGCGSEQRGGWHQYAVAVAMVGGLGVVAWRVIASVRRRPATG